MRDIQSARVSICQLLVLLVMTSVLLSGFVFLAPVFPLSGSTSAEQAEKHLYTASLALQPRRTGHSTAHTRATLQLEQTVHQDIWYSDDTPTPVPSGSDNSPLEYSWIAVLLCMVGLNVITIVVALGFKRRFKSISPEKR